MGIITSNAWLDVNYGYALQRFFCERFKIVAILESRCEPWFTEASVNTVLTIVERCNDAEDRDQHLVKFVKVKKRLADLVPGDPQIEAVERWKGLKALSDRIESAGRKAAMNTPFGIVTEEDENFRIRLCRQGDRRAELEREQKTVKLGLYLRAPAVWFDINNAGHFCLLRDVATPKRGGTTRINEFFHVSKATATKFGIEPEYLSPLIKSPKDSRLIPITFQELALCIFICRRTKAELKKLDHNGALAYIQWGEAQTYRRGEFQGLSWPEGTWVSHRQPGWYALPNTETHTARVFFACAFGDRHLHRFCSTPVIADKRLYFLTPRKDIDEVLLAALMNSALTALSSELVGRLTMGDGVLELTVEEANDYLLVPDIRKTTVAQRKQINAAFEELCKREIGSVFDEVKQKDRQALDTAIFSAIGLNPRKHLKPIYDALCELVRERISLAEQRGKLRKTKARKTKAEKETFTQVIEEHLPNGPKRFPDDFLSVDATKGRRSEIALPDTPLQLDTSPLHMCIGTEKNVFRYIKSSFEGRFIIYCQKAGQVTAHLPDKPVEVSRTVTNYERYLRDLRKTLYESFYRQTLDVALAERLTQAAFDRFNLPKILSD